MVFLLSRSQGISSHLEFIWCSQSYFVLLWLCQGPSRRVTVFLGTVWSAINEVRAPFMFDMEHGIALHEMEGNRSSFWCEAEISWFYWSCGRNLELRRGWTFKTPVCSVTSGLLSSCEGHLMIHHEACKGNRDTSQSEAGDPGSLSSCHRDIRFPINFQEESGSISF